jgi:hypothetical protein
LFALIWMDHEDDFIVTHAYSLWMTRCRVEKATPSVYMGCGKAKPAIICH